MSSGARHVRSQRVLWRRSEAGLVALGDGETPVLITGAGVLLWELLENPLGTDDVAGILAEVHGMEVSTIRAQIEPVVEQLLSIGVLATCD